MSVETGPLPAGSPPCPACGGPTVAFAFMAVVPRGNDVFGAPFRDLEPVRAVHCTRVGCGVMARVLDGE